jgi:hypothetical protein
MNRKPINITRTKKKPGGKCALCDGPMADMRLTIPINEFRGDDDIVNVHQTCVYRKSSESILVELRKLGLVSTKVSI